MTLAEILKAAAKRAIELSDGGYFVRVWFDEDGVLIETTLGIRHVRSLTTWELLTDSAIADRVLIETMERDRMRINRARGAAV